MARRPLRTRVSSLVDRVASSFDPGSRAWVRWTVRIAAGTVAVAFVVGVVVLPVRDYFVQRSALAQKTAEFEALADANEQLQSEVNELKTPEGTRAAARDQLGYVLPGEQRMSLLPMPALPTDLPDGWPYSVVENILSVRALSVTTDRGPLDPLAP